MSYFRAKRRIASSSSDEEQSLSRHKDLQKQLRDTQKLLKETQERLDQTTALLDAEKEKNDQHGDQIEVLKKELFDTKQERDSLRERKYEPSEQVIRQTMFEIFVSILTKPLAQRHLVHLLELYDLAPLKKQNNPNQAKKKKMDPGSKIQFLQEMCHRGTSKLLFYFLDILHMQEMKSVDVQEMKNTIRWALCSEVSSNLNDTCNVKTLVEKVQYNLPKQTYQPIDNAPNFWTSLWDCGFSDLRKPGEAKKRVALKDAKMQASLHLIWEYFNLQHWYNSEKEKREQHGVFLQGLKKLEDEAPEVLHVFFGCTVSSVCRKLQCCAKGKESHHFHLRQEC